MRRSHTRGPRGPALGASAVWLAAAPSVVLVTANPHGVVAAGLTMTGTVVALAIGWSRGSTVSPRIVAAVVAALCGVSCIRAPLGSHDLWSYAMYGRILEHYHANPYVVRPAHFPGDAVLALVGWRHTVSAYGPLFVGLAALVSLLGGAHLLALRL